MTGLSVFPFWVWRDLFSACRWRICMLNSARGRCCSYLIWFHVLNMHRICLQICPFPSCVFHDSRTILDLVSHGTKSRHHLHPSHIPQPLSGSELPEFKVNLTYPIVTRVSMNRPLVIGRTMNLDSKNWMKTSLYWKLCVCKVAWRQICLQA